MNQMWQLWSGIVSDQHIEELKNTSSKYPIADAALGFDGSTYNNEYRKSEIRWLDATAEHLAVSIISYYTKMANRNAFGFDIDFINDIQYTTYYGSDNGKYDWHEDIFWDCPRAYHRKISFILQLSDPSEYEGGEVELDPSIIQPDPIDLKKKGTVLVFPSFLRHRVLPVTSGVRRSLVSWVEGPKFR